MDPLFAEAIVFDQRASATFGLIFLALILIPPYLLLIFLGRRKRSKLVLNLPLLWAYILGLPIALLSLGLTGVLGSNVVENYEAQSNTAGTVLGVILIAALAVGLTGLIGIITQNILVRRKSK